MPIRRSTTVAAVLIGLMVGGVPVAAQKAPAPPASPTSGSSATPATVEDTEALIQRMQQRLQSLDSAAQQRDQALKYLEQQVTAAQSAINGGQQAQSALREGAAALSTRLDAVAQDRERLSSSVNSGAGTIDDLSRQVAVLNTALDAERTGRSAAQDQLAGARKQAEAQAAELDRASQQVAAIQGELESERAARGQAEQRLAELDKGRSAAESDAAARRAELDRLTQQVAGLRQELERTQAQLGAQQSTGAQQQTEIATLSAKLKQTLESRIEELSRYRSEFFGRLRGALGDRPDIRIVGDRFVFQSEVLFASGSAELGPEGQAQLRELARSLRDVSASIPQDIDWILRVDGHTDRLAVHGGPFRDNWELSVERALAVVEFLVRQGLPANRLAAAGFGEFQPLDPSDDEIAYRRNRRIEFKLTER